MQWTIKSLSGACVLIGFLGPGLVQATPPIDRLLEPGVWQADAKCRVTAVYGPDGKALRLDYLMDKTSYGAVGMRAGDLHQPLPAVITFEGSTSSARSVTIDVGDGDGTVGVFGGHVSFADPRRHWDFRSLGHGDINFEDIIVALNDIAYQGPLSVEWEDSRMDREHGATEACEFVRNIDFKPSDLAFDAQFDR